MGLRLSNTCEVAFNDMRVPKENLLGWEGLSFLTAMQGLDSGRISVAAGSIGIAQRALEESVTYAKQRVCFGQAIHNFQSIGFMLADRAKKVEVARLLVDYTITLNEAGKPYTKAASMAKCFATDTTMEVTTDTIQIFCGCYCKDDPVETLLDEALSLANKIAAKPPLAVVYIKTVLRDGMECDLQRGFQIESALFALLFCAQDAKEALTAFMKMRPHKEFVGR